MALFFDKRLLRYEFPDRLEPGSPQEQHSKRLHDSHDHPKQVASDDALYDEIIGSLIGLHLLTEQDLHRPVHLPYPSIGTLFRGRELFLKQLRNSLETATSTAGHSHGRATAIIQQAVHGLGGVGKTRLAVEYAWQHAEQFSAVLFVTADTPATLRQNLAELTGPLILNLPEASATDESAKELDGLALALEQTGAYICRMRISLADYLARWKSHERKVQTWHDRTMNYSRSIDITWQTTLDQLSTEEVALLNILAWLSPDPIPLDIIEHLSPESLFSNRLEFDSTEKISAERQVSADGAADLRTRAAPSARTEQGGEAI